MAIKLDVLEAYADMPLYEAAVFMLRGWRLGASWRLGARGRGRAGGGEGLGEGQGCRRGRYLGD